MQDYDSTALETAVTTEESNAVIVAGDDGEIIDDSGDDERPDDCQCDQLHGEIDLACWSCYREGFETVAGN